jgi:hypothetical protein
LVNSTKKCTSWFELKQPQLHRKEGRTLRNSF